MSNMINFGIDLGTTNSVITKFNKGEVNTFKNSSSWKETTPSVIYFKKDKIVIGDKARERWEKDPKNVLARFKRKMGTNESFKIPITGQTLNPIDLSALILKELKSFVTDGSTVEAAVITIPASFDTIQSNATKQAGEQAGINQVVLLQEPIAASLAYANQGKEKKLKNGYWLVYDLGGGTFDVALVQIKDGEMRIADHEGNNFLGGVDFDQMIVEQILIPAIQAKGFFKDLRHQMMSEKGRYNELYYKLLYQAEQAKIELSRNTSADIEIEVEDEEGEDVEFVFSLTRSDFERLIRSHLEETVRLLQKVLTNNKLTQHDIQFILMVGGSTYIPLVRTLVHEATSIPLNLDIDPTTAIGIGAAYFASTKPLSKLKDKPSNQTQQPTQLKLKIAYDTATQEEEVFIAGKVVEGNFKNYTFRILREDGGYDSGRKPLTEKFHEDLPLVIDAYNFFTLQVFDDLGNPVTTDAPEIGISQGKFSVNGQPLPQDICLEVDNIRLKATKLEVIFEKNAVLPLRKTFVRELNRTIPKNSDQNFIINVVESPQQALPAAGKPIGTIEISGKQLTKDLYQGSDIEITVTMSESRDLTISIYLPHIDQAFEQTFNPKARSVDMLTLKRQVQNLSLRLDEEIADANEHENYERSSQLKELRDAMKKLQTDAQSLVQESKSDTAYQIEDKQRQLAQSIDQLTRGKELDHLRQVYEEQKTETYENLQQHGNSEEHKIFQQIITQESQVLNSQNPQRIQASIEQLKQLSIGILWRTPDFLKGLFVHLIKNHIAQFPDQTQAQGLAMMGAKAIKEEDWPRLREVNQTLLQLLPREAQTDIGQNLGQMGIS